MEEMTKWNDHKPNFEDQLNKGKIILNQLIVTKKSIDLKFAFSYNFNNFNKSMDNYMILQNFFKICRRKTII
jgi:hypothetical protein